MPHSPQLLPATALSWRGDDYVVDTSAALVATAFSWRLALLAPATAERPACIAISDTALWEAVEVFGVGDRPPLDVDRELLSSPRPAETLQVNDRSFTLARFGHATAEISPRSGPAIFDRGRLLEYRSGDDTRLVCFVSGRRTLAFVARRALESELQVYGRPQA